MGANSKAIAWYIDKLTVRGFKSLRDCDLDLSVVNVFIGPNGCGKTNLLEALGVLGAAASGRVDDSRLREHGVRLGTPRLYKSSFDGERMLPSIYLRAGCSAPPSPSYTADLNNPLGDPRPAWLYKTEIWENTSPRAKFSDRRPRVSSTTGLSKDAGLAALSMVSEGQNEPHVRFLARLRDYVIYSPATDVLRGVSADPQPSTPVGLSGGRLAEAVSRVRQLAAQTDHARHVAREARQLIEWAASYRSQLRFAKTGSRAVPRVGRALVFEDRYMRRDHRSISAYDASEGALYVLLMAVLAAHPDVPPTFAVDNFDTALNPRLVERLTRKFCEWILVGPYQRQVLLTTHNPLALDGLDLSDDRIRLFVVERSRKGKTIVERLNFGDVVDKWRAKGMPLSRLWVTGELGGLPSV